MPFHAVLLLRLAICLATCVIATGCAQPGPQLADATPARTIGGVVARAVTLVSEGTRVAGTVYTPAAAAPKTKLPTIVMANGWGGTAAQLETDAIEFAQAGYLVLSFDYRGWGRSESRVLLTLPAPSGTARRYTAEVQEVREVVDAEDMVADWLNALHWLQGEPQCDTARIGLWGTGLSGGMVVTAAVRDGRVKAIYSQVGLFPASAAWRQPEGLKESTRRARGEIGYPPPGQSVMIDLVGTSVPSRFVPYSPIDDVRALGPVALAIVVAKVETVFENNEHGLLAYERHTGPKQLVTLDTTHRTIMAGGARKQAHEVAQSWFDQHLNRPPSR